MELLWECIEDSIWLNSPHSLNILDGERGKRLSPSLESEAAPQGYGGISRSSEGEWRKNTFRVFRPWKMFIASFSWAVVWRPTGGHSLITRKVGDLGGSSGQVRYPNISYLNRKLRARRNFRGGRRRTGHARFFMGDRQSAKNGLFCGFSPAAR